MNVQSLAFLAFLTVTVCVCRLLPKERTWVLLAASLVFYLWGGAPAALWGCGLLAVSSLVSYLAANTLRKHRRKSVLLAVVCYHIAVLGIFKYTGFFTGGAVRMPFVPLGISFFTFQQIWYLREVYAGTFSQVPTPAEYLTYSFFFPTVSSGPILKPGNFFPQLRETSPLPQDTAAGLYAIGLGLAKKVLLADNLGVLVNNGWSSLSELTALTAWCVILGYTLQLYFDFSGYCDLAAGCARLLGLRLPINFDSPYRSLSVTEFWKRWHMTLTAFLRENVYFPLGGSRKGRGRTYLNILVVYLVSGIWHGAGYNYILWGAINGVMIVLERCVRDKGWYQKIPGLVKWAFTMFVVLMSWQVFRLESMSGIAQFFGILFGAVEFSAVNFTWQYYFDARIVVLMVIATVGALALDGGWAKKVHAKIQSSAPLFCVAQLALLLLMVLSVMFMVNSTYSPFIYFQY